MENKPAGSWRRTQNRVNIRVEFSGIFGENNYCDRLRKEKKIVWHSQEDGGSR